MEERHQGLQESHRLMQLAGQTYASTLPPTSHASPGQMHPAQFATPNQMARSSPFLDATSSQGHSPPRAGSGEGKRRVVFAEPTYVDHPGKTWSDTSGEEGENDMDSAEEVDTEVGGGYNRPNEQGDQQMDEDSEDDFGTEEGGSSQGQHQHQHARDAQVTGRGTPDRYEDAPHHGPESQQRGMRPDDMEPDDGVEWDDNALLAQREKDMERRKRMVEAQHRELGVAASPQQRGQEQHAQQKQIGSPSTVLDPADVAQDVEPKRITVTPTVAQAVSCLGVSNVGTADSIVESLCRFLSCTAITRRFSAAPRTFRSPSADR